MAYDFLSQLQGPAVPISLFGEAATAGGNLGKSIPTPLAAGIQGAVEGVKSGLDIYGKTQDIAIRQNQIEQLPTENAIRQQVLENSQLTNTLKTLETERAVANQGLKLEEEQSTLENDISKANSERQIRERTTQFLDAFKQAQPNQQAQMVLGNQFADVFAAQPKLYNQALGQIYNNPQAGLDGGTRATIGKYLRKSEISDTYDKLARQNLPKYIAAEADLFNDPLTGELMSRTGKAAQQIYPNIQFVDTGQYQTGADGTTVLKDVRTGEPLRKPLQRGGVPPVSWDVLYQDPTTKQYKLLAKQIDKDTKKKYDTWYAQASLQNGQSLRSELQEVDTQFSKQTAPKQGQPSKVPTFQGPTEGTAQAQQPMRLQIAAPIINVPENELLKLDPSLKTLEDYFIKSRLDPEFRASATAKVEFGNLTESIAKSIANSRFNSDPALKEQYTPEKVVEANEAILSDAKRKLWGTFGAATSERVERMVGPWLIKTPEDLYFKKNAVLFDQMVRSISKRYTQLANERVTAAVNRSSGTQKLMLQLQEKARGSGQ